MMEILLIFYTSPYHIYNLKLSWQLKTNKSESISQNIPERREPDRMSEYRERKPTSKGLLAWKCQQRNARTRERDSFSLSQASWIGFFAKILLCCWFHYFAVHSRFSKPFWKLPKESRLRPAPYNFPPLEVPSNGIEVNTVRSRLLTNWHLTRTVYHWSLTLRSFKAEPKLTEDDANGFVKALCQFLHPWILNPLF